MTWIARNLSQTPFCAPIRGPVWTPIDRVDLYYPLKPHLAMIFTADRNRYADDAVDVGRLSVESYNHRIYAKSDTQIYGNDPSYLASIAQLPKGELF